MFLKPFKLHPHNSHYEGEYGERQLAWRRAGAVEKVDNLQALLKDRKVETVLEVGCGTGAVLAEVARRGIGTKHIGVDLADPNAHADPDATTLTLLKYDGATLPFPNASFDLVYASHVVEHVPNPRGFLSELSRVTKALVYTEVPCELHFRTTQTAMQTTVDIGHINAYTPESFLLLMQTAGLEVFDLQVFDHSFDVHRFHTSVLIGLAKMAIRRAVLQVSPHLASRVFTYHCGALGRPLFTV